MRKLYLLIAALAITTSLSAQSPRLVLVEEFTGETCPPCAAYNPGFNALMSMPANMSKGVSLKYQNDIPSTGPNFYLYNTADIATRTGFYANNYSPHGFMDGNVWDDNIASFTQTLLDNQAAVTSPFTIAVSHTINGNTIDATVVVTASQAVSNANLKLQVAIAEQDVYGYTSPNGESEYSNVMRKMLPDGNGTTLAATWTNGQSATFNLSWPIAASPTSYPGPVPMQLRVIAFIQDASTKNVLQTGADFNQVTLDPAIGAVTNVPAITCGASITPTVEISNFGSTTITTLDIQYTLDANPMMTFAWTGSLAQGAVTTATLPAITVAPGSHSLAITLANPNGSADQVPANSNATVVFAKPVSAATLTQSFASTTFPPTNWLIENPDNSYTWTRSTAGLSGAGSAKIDFYNSTAGNIDILNIVEGLDLTTATTPALTFDVAHRQYSANENDMLMVEASTDCGATWSTIWSKSGPTLSTVAGYATSAFTPSATQWRNESVSLAAYNGQASVLLRFYANSEFGNNAYVDNVNLTLTPVAIDQAVLDNSISLYPNPAHDQVNVNVSLVEDQTVDFTLMDMTGKVILKQQANGSSFVQSLGLQKVAAGSYMLKVEFNGNTVMKKFSVQ